MLTAESGAEGLALLERDPDEFSVVMSDMRMPIMSGSVFLREARRIAPDAPRILLTGHADVDAAVTAVNEGQLFRFLTKPCPADALEIACEGAVEQHRLMTAERVLLEQTLKGSVKALAEVMALASPAAFGRSARVRDAVKRLAKQIPIDEPWELEVAALLFQIGAVTLPHETAERVYAGAKLSPNEEQMVRRIPSVSRRILENIPRLEGVLEILENFGRSYGEHGAGRSLPIGARILRIALDFDSLEARGADPSVALAAMRSRGMVYDPDLLDAFAAALGSAADTRNIAEITLGQLRAGMMLADDVRSTTGTLLIARGFTATDQLVERLRNLTSGSIREPLMVLAEDII